MSIPSRPYQLAHEPGSLGLSCESSGLALAGAPLLRKTPTGFAPRPASEISALMARAYGQGLNPARLTPGLEVVARALNQGDLGRAMIAAVRLRLPELSWDGAKRIAQAERGLTKYNSEELRDWHGRWTDGADGTAKPVHRHPPRRRPRQHPSPALQIAPTREVRPETLTHIVNEEEPRGIGDNRPPGIIDDLREIFPWLPDSPMGAILAPIDGVLDISGPGNEANAAATEATRRFLMAQIKAINPRFRFDSLDPGGMPGTWQGRANLIDDLLAERAAAFYKFRRQIGPLQVETLRFLQKRVDAAYRDGMKLFEAGRIGGRLSRQEAIGNYIDATVREELREFYNRLDISWGYGQQVRVNSREYDTSSTDRTYRIPDSRVGDIAFDVTLTPKTPGSAQIRGFFNSDFKPVGVVIVRPSQLGRNSTYLILRPARQPHGI